MIDRKNTITYERLLEILEYREDTGKFYRKSSRLKKFVGSETGKLDKSGYIHVFVDGRRYQAHRLAWLYVMKQWPVSDIDHINRVRTDNRICNLREANESQNCQNSDNSRGVSKYRGVAWHKRNKRWISHIQIAGKHIHLGSFDTEEQAFLAYKNARDKLHPFYVGTQQ